MTNYAALNDVKDRLLIINDTSYDGAINTAMNEASVVVDAFLVAYTTVPLNSTPSLIAIATADIAASIFKRRMMPEDVEFKGQLAPDTGESEIIARGWFGQGIQKLEQYIRSVYVIGTAITTISNPQIYMDLYNKKLITAKEAREFMTNAAAVVKNVTDTLVKNLTETNVKVDIKSTTETVTRREYITKKQNQFCWIQSDEDDGYEQQGS